MIVDSAFSDHAQGHVGELHKISASANAPMLRDERIYASVNHLDEQSHEIWMHSGASLEKRPQAGYH